MTDKKSPVDAAATHTRRSSRAISAIIAIAPGVTVAAAIATAATLATPIAAKFLPVPAVVIALLFGMTVSHWAAPSLQAGLSWCVGPLLRAAVAFLGLKIAFGDIAALGSSAIFIVVAGMGCTIAVSLVISRALALPAEFGALAGAANAVCGASAALATAAVLPAYRNKNADVAFVVVAANAISTAVMLLYPMLCSLLGMEAHETGVMLGGSIQDMAQVVGAGYAVSPATGDTAVIVKLFRILLLAPVILLIGQYFALRTPVGEEAVGAPPVPIFALMFLLFAGLNSYAAGGTLAGLVFDDVKQAVGGAVGVAFLIAIAALGIKTSVRDLMSIGWRRVAVFFIAGTFLALFVSGSIVLKLFPI